MQESDEAIQKYLDQWALASVLFHEARGESQKVQLGVGWCVMNRADSGFKGDTVTAVITREWQFEPIHRLTLRESLMQMDADQNAFHEMMNLSRAILARQQFYEDPTLSIGGADHFHDIWIETPTSWIGDIKAEMVIDNMRFYRLRPEK